MIHFAVLFLLVAAAPERDKLTFCSTIGNADFGLGLLSLVPWVPHSRSCVPALLQRDGVVFYLAQTHRRINRAASVLSDPSVKIPISLARDKYLRL